MNDQNLAVVEIVTVRKNISFDTDRTRTCATNVNRFLVDRLNHSATVSLGVMG